jgi:hypothetical protein
MFCWLYSLVLVGMGLIVKKSKVAILKQNPDRSERHMYPDGNGLFHERFRGTRVILRTISRGTCLI